MRKYLLLCITLLTCAIPVNGQASTFPQRIISLGPINTENVYLLGAEDRLVANTSYCVRPEAAKAKTKVGSVMQVSIEKILSLRPDLILATGLTQPQQLNKLRELGLRVEQFPQSSSFAEICTQFRRLGAILGLEQRAEEVIREMEDKVKAISTAAAALPKRKVFLQIGATPLFGAAANSFTHDFIRLSNAINVIGEQQNGTVSYEKILARNPEVIIIAIMGSETGIAGEEKRKWQRFPLHAVNKDQVYIVPPDLVCSPSPATFAEALALVAGLIHPELKAGQ
ncbi:ABC transporter substrate-binding protein [Candidatus Electrothrix sp.]|uniref:ABC transporter substrate-binding protein n=1 Tax=Candidatus Electrothrix sp. TaxID=2170559 RepID=UPI0040567D46